MTAPLPEALTSATAAGPRRRNAGSTFDARECCAGSCGFAALSAAVLALPILAVTDVLGRISRTGAEQRYFVPPPTRRRHPHRDRDVLLRAPGGVDRRRGGGPRRAALGDIPRGGAGRMRRRILCAIAIADPARLGQPGNRGPDPWINLNQPLGIFLPAWLYGSMACIVYVKLRTARLAADRMRAAELARVKSRRRTLESQLQAMQARVEPEFLFNTLAQVRGLYERDVVMAGRMLEDLIAYLRAALPHLRESSSTLGQEVALVRAYLDIVRIRLGEGLTFEIDVPETAEGARIPPMMLLPLVDHALASGRGQGDGRSRSTSRRRFVRVGCSWRLPPAATHSCPTTHDGES